MGYQDLRDCTTGPKTPPKPKEEVPTEKPKAEKSKAKKEKKEAVKSKDTKDNKVTTKAPAKAASSTTQARSNDGPEERVDSQTFLRHLAEKHGLTSDEYLTSRTERDWEKLIVAMAGRIFNRVADSEPNESCRAN